MTYRVPDVTFVTTKSGDPGTFGRNFAASPCIQKLPGGRVIVQHGFASASLAYNDAIDKAVTDLIVFAHQDVFFPDDWIENLSRSLTMLEQSDRNWGVLGCSGTTRDKRFSAYLYSTGLGIVGKPFSRPVPVDTLDEFVLILRKSSGLRFDPALPHYHFYATDICMSAAAAEKKAYVVCAFAVHNTRYGPLSEEFYRCYWHLKRKWKRHLPIQTPCIRITRWNADLIRNRIRNLCFAVMGRDMSLKPRLEDPRVGLRNMQPALGLASEETVQGALTGPTAR